MTARPLPHVRVEMRRVYVSARGPKLTRHAAYVAAAKDLIRRACECTHEMNWSSETGLPLEAVPSVCRFHEIHYRDEIVGDCGERESVSQGMAHYVAVKNRLVRFLKFVDARRQT